MCGEAMGFLFGESLCYVRTGVFFEWCGSSFCAFVQSERDGFATFHVYVCAALLAHFSGKIKRRKDFQVIINSFPQATIYSCFW